MNKVPKRVATFPVFYVWFNMFTDSSPTSKQSVGGRGSYGQKKDLQKSILSFIIDANIPFKGYTPMFPLISALIKTTFNVVLVCGAYRMESFIAEFSNLLLMKLKKK
ncbi:hypothetical protein HT574_10470 [Parageobacillus sp. VR-IP]|uniref:hypothetical protein n=1 Tax=Parageobacillus sp. VR-IP TaxID=2742205 RepID=UPI0015832872|nr:hypothetical protein [Parageobacillus sp. VR-IP]NUK30497.1 hypothetical protein [Parageobacillus sp. VR-IP]